MPPVIRTLPLCQQGRGVPVRALDIDPVELNEPVPGSYSSADARRASGPPTKMPPVIRTLPLASKVAVCPYRGLDMDPVELNEPVAGSYSSADARTVGARADPAVSASGDQDLAACQQGRGVPHRAVDMDPVELNEPVAGSYSSADAKPEPSRPPVIRTLPLASKVAVCAARTLDMDPVELNEPWGASRSVGAAKGHRSESRSVGVAVDVVVAVAVGL
jgi:hypothetical protein